MDEWTNAGHFGPAPEYAAIPGPWEEGLKFDKPFPAAPVVTQSPEVARDLVLAQAGAWPRDAIDAGIVRTVLKRTGDAGVKQTIPADLANVRPVASASASGTGKTVRFTADASDEDGRVLSYSWRFGDGCTALGKEVTHAYEKPGHYTARLVAMDDMGMTSVTRVKVPVQPGKPVTAELIESEPAGQFRPFESLADEPPVSIRVARTKTPPDETDFPPDSEWQAAARLHPFLLQSSWRAVPDREIDVRAMHDGLQLLLRALADIPVPQRIGSARRSVPERWGHDCFEIYLSPQWGVEPWFHFVIHVNGAKYDAYGFARDWTPQPDWRVVSRGDGKKWRLDIAVPLKSIGLDPPPKGGSIGVKLCHYRAKDEILLWPALRPGSIGRPHVVYSPDPTSYARLVLE